MQQDWPSQEQDLQDANFILSKYEQSPDEATKGFDISTIEQTNKITIKAPEWIIEMAHYFDDKYGNDLGREITKKVITKFLLRAVTIH